MTAKEAYDLLCGAEYDVPPAWRARASVHWVMNLEWYKAIRRAFLRPDASDEDRDEAKWVPDNDDMVLFRYITVTEDGGAPHLVDGRLPWET